MSHNGLSNENTSYIGSSNPNATYHGSTNQNSLLDGEYDERESASSFQEALKEWRNGGETLGMTF